MHKIGFLNNRNIFYNRFLPQTDWAANLPAKNWLAIIMVSGRVKADLFEISGNVLGKNVCYVCCASDQGELLHDLLDDHIAIRQLGPDNKPAHKNDIMTTWHDDIPDGLWYGIYTADDPLLNITEVVCLDASQHGMEPEVIQLVTWFGDGYIPPD